MRHYGRIIVTGDIFRYRLGDKSSTPSVQDGNIIWLNDLLSPLFHEVLDKKTELLTSKRSAEYFDLKGFLAIKGHDADYHGWLANYNRTEITVEEKKVFQDSFKQATIVGFELSPFQRALFSECGTPWINLSIHPARFNEDLFFRVETNDNQYQRVLDKYSISYSVLKRHANYLATGYRRTSKRKLQLGSILFCGQVKEDASLISGRRMVKIGDYFDHIRNIANSYSHLYFKPHPYAEEDKALIDFIDGLDNASFIDGDIYELLSLPSINAVAAISSGTLFEAKLFGKEVIRLLDNQHNIENLSIVNTLDKTIIDAPFWAEMFQAYFPVKKICAGLMRCEKNAIQKSLGISWKHKPSNLSISNYPLIDLGAVYTGNNIKKFIQNGWSGVEQWGVWMTKSSSILRFRFPSLLSTGVLLHITLRPWNRKNIVTFFIKNNLVKRVSLDMSGDQEFTMHIPKGFIGKYNTLEITICSENSGISPDQLSSTADYRPIHLGLTGIYVTPEDNRIPCSNFFEMDLSDSYLGRFGFENWHFEEMGGGVLRTQALPARIKLNCYTPLYADTIVRLMNCSVGGVGSAHGLIIKMMIGDALIGHSPIIYEGGLQTISFKIYRELIKQHSTIDLVFSLITVDSQGNEIAGGSYVMNVPKIVVGNLASLDGTYRENTYICSGQYSLTEGLILESNRMYYFSDISDDVVLKDIWRKALVKGWSGIESGAIWSYGDTAIMQFSVNEKTGNLIEVTLRGVSSLLGNVLDAENTAIYIGDMQATVTMQPSESGNDLIIQAPASSIKDRSLRILFQFKYLSSPKSLGSSSDSRRLGINVKGLEYRFIEREFINCETVGGVRKKIGVSVIGQTRLSTGMGVATRNVAGLLAKSIGSSRVSLVNYDKSNHVGIELEFEKNFSNNPNQPISIFLIPPPVIESYVEECGWGRLKSSYSICFGAWELESLPSRLSDDSLFDEYWGISRFVAQGAAKVVTKPVKPMPLPVNVSWPSTFYSRKDLGLPSNTFLFLFTYCVDSTIARKNPLATIKAFQRAFPPTERGVGLILKAKVRQADAVNRAMQEGVIEAARDDGRIIIIEENWPLDKVKSLFIAVDAYVSLHRSEGYGLTIAEAMGYGKPVIATAYSGNLDFMNTTNSLLVDYQLVKLGDYDYHGQSHQSWAEPDIDHAAKHMRDIYEDNLLRVSVGRRGQTEIMRNFSYDAVAKKMLARIEEIRGLE